MLWNSAAPTLSNWWLRTSSLWSEEAQLRLELQDTEALERVADKLVRFTGSGEGGKALTSFRQMLDLVNTYEADLNGTNPGAALRAQQNIGEARAVLAEHGQQLTEFVVQHWRYMNQLKDLNQWKK